MSKVKDKILKEAEGQKKRIEEEARATISEIRKKAENEAQKIENSGKEKAEQEKKLETERILSRIRMELANRKLEKKNKIMNELKEKVTADMKNLKWEGEYELFIRELILNASKDGDEEIIPGVLHNGKVRELIERLNREKNRNFKISNIKGDFEVGIVMSKDKKRINATLPVLLEETFDRMQEEIVSSLFKNE